MRRMLFGILATSLLLGVATVRVSKVEARPLATSGVAPFFLAGVGKEKTEPAPPACPATFDDSPAGNGIYKTGRGSGVTPPKAIHTVNAEPSEKARIAFRKGETSQDQFISVIRFVVDKEGMPGDLCVQRSAPYDLDAEAAKAVKQFRFEPATKDGVPVAVRISIEMSFRFK